MARLSTPRLRSALLLLAASACVHAAPTPEQPTPPAPAPPAPAPVAPAAPEPEATPGPQLPFKFDPPVQKAWGLRVARHRTLPSSPGQESLHFDSEESTRIWATRASGGNWTLHEVLAEHFESKNGEPNDDPLVSAFAGVDVALELSPEGRFVTAVEPGKALKQAAQNYPGGRSSLGELPADNFAKDLERDWRLGAQVYLDHPVYANVPVYSLLSVSLPELPSHYVVMAETFGPPSPGPDGNPQAVGTQVLFGKRDPRWVTARQHLAELMSAVGVKEDDLLDDFAGKGTETVDLTSLKVYSSNYEGEGIYPLVTQRGVFPLRFLIEEVAGLEAPKPLPPRKADPLHSASL